MRTTLLLSGLLLAAALTGCSSSEQTANTATGTPKPVSAVKADRLTTGAHDEIMGTVRARNTADLSTKVQARIDRIPVVIGSRVNRGGTLAELDTREFKARVQQARAVKEQADLDLTRYTSLLDKDAVTKQEFDAVKARASVAEANLDEAEALMSYATITAPFSGVVTRKMVDVGDLAIPGQPLFTLEEESAPQFVVTIPESQRTKIAIGDQVQVEISSLDTAITGTVKELSPSADPVTRSFIVKIDLPASIARPGQFGRLLLSVGGDESIYIPSAALVRLNAENVAVLKFVRTGRSLGDKIEILAGLESHDLVVTRGLTGLVDGDKVEVQP
ncbi:MAG: efflux RND transporter periplasmic adaptor subunit [bacterium]|nr:efflux RND transporter periplasmic adaptor subunit [bacterium]